MNYKSGDLVKIAGNNNSHDFSMGEIVRLKRNCGGERRVWVAEYLDGHDFWYVRESDMAPVKPAIMPQKIVITTDGKTTLARLFDGKTMVKRAEAKCAPSDTFDFGVGTELAVKRLMGDNPVTEPAKESEPEPVNLYCVEAEEGYLTKGKIYELGADGKLVYDLGETSGRYKTVDAFFRDYSSWETCLVPLVRRPAKVGEWVLVTDSTVDRFIGTVGKVERINSDGNPSVRHKKVWFDTHGDGTENTSMNGCNYLVLDGYHGDPT